MFSSHQVSLLSLVEVCADNLSRGAASVPLTLFFRRNIFSLPRTASEKDVFHLKVSSYRFEMHYFQFMYVFVYIMCIVQL